MWDGETVFIIGGGPSLKGADLSPLRGRRVIGVNDAYQLGDWVEVCYFGDRDWYQHHAGPLSFFNGMVVTDHPDCVEAPGVLGLQRMNHGIYDAPQLGWLINSGASACNLAYILGAGKIVLVGFDMKKGPEGESNWHPNAINPIQGAELYKKFTVSFKIIRDVIVNIKGIPVINANPDSALPYFPKVPLQEAFRL